MCSDVLTCLQMIADVFGFSLHRCSLGVLRMFSVFHEVSTLGNTGARSFGKTTATRQFSTNQSVGARQKRVTVDALSWLHPCWALHVERYL